MLPRTQPKNIRNWKCYPTLPKIQTLHHQLFGTVAQLILEQWWMRLERLQSVGNECREFGTTASKLTKSYNCGVEILTQQLEQTIEYDE